MVLLVEGPGRFTFGSSGAVKPHVSCEYHEVESRKNAVHPELH